LQELSRECKASLDKEFERFGVELVNFFIESVTPPKDQYEKLRGYKEEMALGAGFYQQRRSLDIMEKMAENPNSGGLANAGIGFGMGLGMAPMAGTMFGNVAGNVNPQQPAEAAGVKCPHCGATNPEGRKFCGECGQSIVVGLVCPSCGKVNEKGQKFCGDCGTRLSKKCPTCGKDYDLAQKFCGDCGTKL
jgi:membrane protease subunit (stomatin/prohibitin family)